MRRSLRGPPRSMRRSCRARSPGIPESRKREMSRPRWLCVTQMFNHQTHHRGQVNDLAEAGRRRSGCDGPALGAFGPRRAAARDPGRAVRAVALAGAGPGVGGRTVFRHTARWQQAEVESPAREVRHSSRCGCEVIVLHRREALHQRRVFIEFLAGAEHEFVHQLAAVPMHEPRVSPCRTSMKSGTKRILSVIVTSMVRLTALASPAMPHGFCSRTTGPDGLPWFASPCADAATGAASSAATSAPQRMPERMPDRTCREPDHSSNQLSAPSSGAWLSAKVALSRTTGLAR